MAKKEFFPTTTATIKTKNPTTNPETPTKDPTTGQTPTLPNPLRNPITDTMTPPTDPETSTKTEEGTTKDPGSTESRKAIDLHTTIKMMATREDQRMRGGFRMTESTTGKVQKSDTERRNTTTMDITGGNKAISTVTKEDSTLEATTIMEEATSKRYIGMTTVRELQNATKRTTTEAGTRKTTKKSTMTSSTGETTIEGRRIGSTTGTGRTLPTIAVKYRTKEEGLRTATEVTVQITRNDQ